MTGNVWVVIPGAAKGKRIGIVKVGEKGYYLTDYDTHNTEDEALAHVRLMNEARNIPYEVEQSALEGSMFGWDCPAAQTCLDFFEEEEK